MAGLLPPLTRNGLAPRDVACGVCEASGRVVSVRHDGHPAGTMRCVHCGGIGLCGCGRCQQARKSEARR